MADSHPMRRSLPSTVFVASLITTVFALALLVPVRVSAQNQPGNTETPAPQTPDAAAPIVPVAPPPVASPEPLPTAAPLSPPAVAPNPAPPLVVTPVAAAPAPPKQKFPTRSLRIGPSLQVQLYDPFPYEKLSRVGTGLFGAYEFYLKPSFAIGINLSYRYHPGKADLHQVGYGLLLKHYLAGTSSPDSTFMPFVEYGLLLQMNMLTNRKGFGTAHDTRLSAGTDIRINKRIFFVEGSWHYSRLGLFEKASERLDDLEFNVGYRYPW